MQNEIKKLAAKEILNSQKIPTVKVELTTNFGKFFASVPSGVSTGKYEARELRDKDGKGGVKKAIENIEKIIFPALIKEDFLNQKRLDEVLIKLDGTKNKSRLGANAILAVSIALCRAAARAKKLPLYQYINEIAIGRTYGNLPKPSFNMIEGGKHGEAGLAFQEFMFVPQKEKFQDNLKIGKTVYQKLKNNLEKKFGRKNVKLSAEGAFAPPIKRISEALDFILAAAKEAGDMRNIKIALDAAASEFQENNYYKVDANILSREELLAFYKKLAEKYPIILIEDPFSEEDFEGFAKLKNWLGKKVLIFGDDLTVSNTERMEQARKNKSISGLVLKPNQIGTVTETLEAAKMAKDFGWKIMVANRAGETEDDFIADLAVGINADFIKSGAPFPEERMAKYNRLLAIEKELQK